MPFPQLIFHFFEGSLINDTLHKKLDETNEKVNNIK